MMSEDDKAYHREWCEKTTRDTSGNDEQRWQLTPQRVALTSKA